MGERKAIKVSVGDRKAIKVRRVSVGERKTSGMARWVRERSET